MHVSSIVMYTVNESRTLSLHVMLCMEMVRKVQLLPANGSACHPPASSLFLKTLSPTATTCPRIPPSHASHLCRPYMPVLQLRVPACENRGLFSAESISPETTARPHAQQLHSSPTIHSGARSGLSRPGRQNSCTLLQTGGTQRIEAGCRPRIWPHTAGNTSPTPRLEGRKERFIESPHGAKHCTSFTGSRRPAHHRGFPHAKVVASARVPPQPPAQGPR